MTFRVYFYADQAFLNIVKRKISLFANLSKSEQENLEAEDTACCYVCCHAAIEAFLNLLGQEAVLDFGAFERLGIEAKMETLLTIKKSDINWGKSPWQDIKCIIRVRNWLTHFKSPDIGLINSMGQWISDSYNKKPKIDDQKELSMKKLNKHYQNTRKALYALATLFDRNTEFDHLLTEKYNVYLVG